jgi:hypothetical protein
VHSIARVTGYRDILKIVIIEMDKYQKQEKWKHSADGARFSKSDVTQEIS